jgi:hypothetical protein
MSFTVQANWKRRAEIIDYCVKVVDEAQVGQSDHRAGTDVGTRPSSSSLSLGGTDEAKYRQVHNELAIEKIIRRRSIDAFVSRCRYFEPPQSDADGQRWWKEAHERR